MKNVFGYALLGLALLGCGDSSDSSSPPVAPIPVEPPRVQGTAESLNLTSSSADQRLTGTWTSSCLRNDDGSSRQVKVEITPNYVQETLSLFRYENCASLVMDARFISSYAAAEDQFKTTLQETHVKLYDPQFAQAARKGSSCGFDNWKVGPWYDLTDRTCIPARDCLWVSPTLRGTEIIRGYAIQVYRFDVRLTLDGVTLSRPPRASDVQGNF